MKYIKALFIIIILTSTSFSTVINIPADYSAIQEGIKALPLYQEDESGEGG